MFWRFEPHPEQLEPLVANHHPGLAVLAFALAVLAALTVLPVVERIRSATTFGAGLGWLVSGATAVGCGVWAMHFTAILAHRLPVPVTYDPGITLFSVVPIALGAAGLFIITRLRLTRRRRLCLAALSFGLGAGAMHYLGMEAIVAPVSMRYDPVLVALSLVAVVGLAWLGLAANLLLLQHLPRWLAYLGGAVLLALSICVMHVAAMNATEFFPAPMKSFVGEQISPQTIGTLVAAVVLLIVLLLLLAVLVDRRFSHIVRSLSTSERRFELLAETSDSGIFTCYHSFDYTNPAMSHITGYEEGELHQMPVVDLLGFEPEQELSWDDADEHLYRETRIDTKDGDCRWLYITLSRLHGDDRKRYLGSAFDITGRKQMEQELRYLAFNDPLTDLPNRKFFMSRLSMLVNNATDLWRRKRGGEAPAFAVMFVDVNRFKLINDNFGLSKGDQLLEVIARRIKSALPQALLVSRVGGDEFALLFEGPAQIQWVEREAQRLHDAFEQPFRLGEQEFFLSLSIGVAHYQHRYTDAEPLYRDATLAKDAAKKEGLGITCVFDHAMHQSAERHLVMERALRKALRENAFELWYQPIVGLPNGELRGFEALVRWRAEDGSLIPPREFIGLAEETGLINRLGDWVLMEACRQIKHWQQSGGADREFYVSVNLSSVQFFQTGLIDTVRSALEQNGVRPGQLKLELTEGVLVDDNPQVIERMRQLRAMGCEILVDDFGTGYSSLSYLQRFPIGTLKIDQSFTARLNENTGLHLVRAIVSMAHALELGVVAEGIESQAVADTLVALGCDQGQGFYYGRPLSATQAGERLRPAPVRYAQGALFQ